MIEDSISFNPRQILNLKNICGIVEDIVIEYDGSQGCIDRTIGRYDSIIGHIVVTGITELFPKRLNIHNSESTIVIVRDEFEDKGCIDGQ